MVLVRWVTGRQGLTKKCSGTAYLAIFVATRSLSSWRTAVGLSMKPSFKTTKANGTGTHTHTIYSGKYRITPAGGVIAQEVKVPCCLSDNNAAQPVTGVANTHYKNGNKEHSSRGGCMFSVTFSFDLMRKSNYSCFWNSWMFILDHNNNSSLRNIVNSCWYLSSFLLLYYDHPFFPLKCYFTSTVSNFYQCIFWPKVQ